MSSLSFNGTSDFARSGSPPVTAYPFTICIWTYPTSLAANARAAGLYDSAGSSTWGLTQLATGFLRLNSINSAGTSVNSDTTNAASANSWSLLCGVFTSATSRRAILNGNIAGATTVATSSAPSSINRFSIGAADGSAQSAYWPGQLGETAAWSAALTDAEVTALAAGWSPLKIQPHKLVFLAPYLGVGSTVLDWFGHPLTVTGAATNANTQPLIGHP